MTSWPRRAPLLAVLLLGMMAQQGAARFSPSTGPVKVAVTGPTIVAFYAESTGDDQEALADFEFYLGKVGPTLDSAGVKLVVAFTDTVYLTWSGGRKQTLSTRDSIRVGYGFTDRRRPLALEYGVLTDIDLLCKGARHLGVSRLEHWCS